MIVRESSYAEVWMQSAAGAHVKWDPTETSQRWSFERKSDLDAVFVSVTMAQWKSKVWKIYCLAMGSNLVPNYGGRSSPKLGLLEERKKLAVVL